ncbi:MAG: hypothetical protein FWG16_03010 [Micrococcales bacterium]|nr:hypothetical protein [Micrococcales bacterium]
MTDKTSVVVLKFATIACMCFTISGCGETIAGDESQIKVATYDSKGENAGDSANLVGTLSLRDGCLVVEEDLPTDPTIPILPSGQVKVLNSDTLLLFGREYSIGDEISLGGGGGELTSDVVEDEYYSIPDTCLGLSTDRPVMFRAWTD